MEHILFIGNSHTYFNDMPAIFRRICKWSSKEVFCVMLAHGGVGLDYHAAEPEAPHNIVYGGYDRVVLQHKANPFEPEIFKESATELSKLIKKGGAEGTLYMPWPKDGDRELQPLAVEGYTAFAKESGFSLAPAGVAFWRFSDAHPEIPMFRKDGMHASKKASYLAACCIYSAIYDERAKTDGEALHEEMAALAYDTYLEFKEKICL